MWVILFQRYWSQLLLALLLLFSLLGWAITKNDLYKSENEKEQYKSALDFQNTTLLNDAKKYEEKLKQLPKEITKIKTKYEVIYTNIDNFQKDENETDCNASYRLLSTNNY